MSLKEVMMFILITNFLEKNQQIKLFAYFSLSKQNRRAFEYVADEHVKFESQKHLREVTKRIHGDLLGLLPLCSVW